MADAGTPVDELRAAARLLRGEPAPEPHPMRLPPKMPDVYAEPLHVLLDALADEFEADLASDCDCWTTDPLCRAALATARAVNGAAA